MTQNTTDGDGLTIKCICGSTDINHSHHNHWKCGGCGRFHDGESLDRLADKARRRSDQED